MNNTWRQTVKTTATLTVATMAALIGFTTQPAQVEDVVNIYSYRKSILIKPLLTRFSEKTGIQVQVVSGKADALLERLKSEGANSPADVLLTADVGRLIRAKNAGVLQAVESATLRGAIGPAYRDPDGQWFGLSVRSRVIVRSTDRVGADEIASYEDLTDPKWKGRICIRSSGNIYNQSLLASLIAHHGAAAAESWATAVTQNMARKPQGGDRDQIKAVVAGECDIAVVNTYYLANMLASGGDQAAIAQKVSLVWPNQADRGAHVNISGGAVTKSAQHRDAAVKLLEFLASDEAQAIYAGSVYEYPIRPGATLPAEVAAWGDFKADDLNLSEIGAHQTAASLIFDRAGWR